MKHEHQSLHDEHSVDCACRGTKHENQCAIDGCAFCKRSRPGWDLFFMRITYNVASRGSCSRRQVGALIVRDGDRRIISAGYNGAPRGLPDCFEVGCKLVDTDGKPNCVRTLHAESNALDLAGTINHDEPHTLYCTTIPCYPCALRIIQAGIDRVIYHEYYESRGTSDVEALFATRTHHRRTDSYVKLIKFDVSMATVKASYAP